MVAFKRAKSALGLACLSTLMLSAIALPQATTSHSIAARRIPEGVAGHLPTKLTTMMVVPTSTVARNLSMSAVSTVPANSTTMAAAPTSTADQANIPKPVVWYWGSHLHNVVMGVIDICSGFFIFTDVNIRPANATVPSTSSISRTIEVTDISRMPPTNTFETQESSFSTGTMVLTTSTSMLAVTAQATASSPGTISIPDITSPRNFTRLQLTSGSPSLPTTSSLSAAPSASAASSSTTKITASSASTKSSSTVESTTPTTHKAATKSSSSVSATSSTSESRMKASSTSSSSSPVSSSSRMFSPSSTSRSSASYDLSRAPSSLASYTLSRAPSSSSTSRSSASYTLSRAPSSSSTKWLSTFATSTSMTSSTTSQTSPGPTGHRSASSASTSKGSPSMTQASSSSRSHHFTSSTSSRKKPFSTSSSPSSHPKPTPVAVAVHTSGPRDYYPAQLSQQPDYGRRRYVYTMAYAVAASAAGKMLTDLGAMEECSSLTWCGSSIWSWINFAAQQAVTRSNIADDEIAGKVIDDVLLAEHALEGSSRSGLFMMQKTYKLVTGMRRLPEYGDLDWEDILPREKAATEAINEQLRVLQEGPVVERAEVLKAIETAKLEPPEPLPTPQSELNPWDEGYPGSSNMRNLLLGLNDSPAESLRSLSEGPPKDPYHPGGPSNPGPGGPNRPPNPPSRPPPVGIDPVRISRITRVLNKLSFKFKNVLESIKNMFKKAFSTPGKGRSKPDSNKRPPTRDPLKPQPGTRKASRPSPKLKSVPKQTNSDDPLDDFQRGNPWARGFDSADLPRAPKPISINKPSKGLQINDGFGQRKLKPNEPLFQETFDSGRGNLAPRNVKPRMPGPSDLSWDEDTVEAANLDFLQNMGLIETLDDAELAGADVGIFVMSSQALRPISLDKGKAKASLIEDAADNCALSRRRDCVPLLAPGGLASLTIESVDGVANPIFDTLGQPLISTVGPDGGQRMLGVRPDSDGIYRILKNSGAIAYDAGRLTYNTAAGAYQWLSPYNRTGKPSSPALTPTPSSTTAGRPPNATLPVSPGGHNPVVQPTLRPKPPHPAEPLLNCSWTDYKLSEYEVWSARSLPPGCSTPTFYECTPDWTTYTACTFPQNARACKKLRQHNPAAQCPTHSTSTLSPQYLDSLGPKTRQRDCAWNSTLGTGMVWSNPHMAPGCTRPVPWECTREWERWFYNGSDAPRVKPTYCNGREPGEAGIGHDLALGDMDCGYDFGGEGCREKFLQEG